MYVAVSVILSTNAWADGGDAARGSVLYAAQCTSCHGVDADGNGPAAVVMNPRPTNLVAASFWQDRTDEQVVENIRNGTPGTSMMAFSHLEEQDLDDLVAYLRSEARQRVAEDGVEP